MRKILAFLIFVFSISAAAESWVVTKPSKTWELAVDVDSIRITGPNTRQFYERNRFGQVLHFYPIEINCKFNIKRWGNWPYYENGVKKEFQNIGQTFDWGRMDMKDPEEKFYRDIVCLN